MWDMDSAWCLRAFGMSSTGFLNSCMAVPLAVPLLLLRQGGWYEGEWVDGERHGSGVRLMRNGSIKVGDQFRSVSPCGDTPMTEGFSTWQ